MKLFLQIITVVCLTIQAKAASTNGFMISFWCGPSVGGNYDATYAEVAECNFTHAMSPCSSVSLEENKAILDACLKHGLKYIAMDGRRDTFTETNPAFGPNLDAILADYVKHPAYGGQYLYDEPKMSQFNFLAAQNQYLLKKDPAHLPFINLLPIYVDPAYSGTNYEAYVDIYCRKVKPALLCYDHYALFENVERESYFENMEVIRRAGLKYNIPMGFIFQTTPHGTYRDPSEIDLRWQVNSALAYGCKALFYFTYFTITDPEANFHNGIIDPKGNRTVHYDMARRINAELKTMGGTLMQLTSTAVYHTGKLPGGCTKLPVDAPIQVEGAASLVLGFFKHADGSRWAIIVNRDLRKPVSSMLTFDKKILVLKELSPQSGKLSKLRLNQNKAVFDLGPGGIKLMKFQYGFF
jgi:hypothetical protein